MPAAPKKPAGSRPWSSRMPSWLMVSTVTVSPERTVSAGFAVALGEQAPAHPGGVGGQVVVAVQGAESGLEEFHFRASRRASEARVNPKHWRTL